MARPDVSEERRAQILDAALEVFARQGFHEARMDDIAQASGLSKGALYLYYKSKDAIIGALLTSIFNIAMRGPLTVEREDGTIRDRLLEITERFAGEIDRFSRAMPVMLEFYAIAARDRTVRKYMGEIFEEYSALVARLLEQGMARGEFRGGSDAHDLAVGLIAIWEGMALLWAMSPERVQWREQATLAVTTFLDGLTPPSAS
ncbi:MAG TPA: TetR family transcriptional regulator [Ktedonobacterales bacterium]|jgi:AcrR family transcriptional regulator|nr:TetR family transcriptional regulator [Ktedonobacterales bacterium]